jgi:uncharacterized protein (DUF1015 family)
VPDFLPFRGTRYRDVQDATPVVAPPYDVIDEEERAALEARDPHNAVRLILPHADPPQDPYELAASTLTDWVAASILAPDAEPAFYAYQMGFTDESGAARRTIGAIGALQLPDPGADDVLGHERTLPKARSDRLALLRATRANFDPIWGLSLAPGLTELLAGAAPASTAVDDTGTHHEVAPVREAQRLAAVRELVASAPLVLADGHHRFDTARTYRDERPDDGPGRAIMAFVVELDESMLDVRAIHRLIHGAPDDLRARVGDAFSVENVGSNTDGGFEALRVRMDRDDALGLVDRDGLAALVPTPATRDLFDRALPNELRKVDAARFEVALRPALGQAELSYRDDGRAVAGMVDKGAADAAVLLRPVTVADIRAAAFARLLMPEKTTFFSPKPRTGMVFRRFDDDRDVVA